MLLVLPAAAQQLSFSQQQLNFPSKLKGQLDSLPLTLTNSGNQNIEVTGVFLHHRFLPDFFYAGDTVFNIAAGQNKTIYVYFKPRHNINYNGELVIQTKQQGAFNIDVRAVGQYPGTYYNNTFDRYEQGLKDQLKTILNSGTLSLGYNAARDWMFLNIDNKRVNGEGASVNTLECVYTGRLITGFTSRSDAQTNGNINTEHTYPQSMFNSSEPMQSDLFHLFVVDAGVNSRRSNHPFGVVANPTWEGGGSKYSSSVFEPRNEHKGDVARSMLYFVTRFQNYNSFLTNQEAILRTWDKQFPVDRQDSLRNEAIFVLQRNRNPYVDHPEFLDRITSISNQSVATAVRNFELYPKVNATPPLKGLVGDTLFQYVITNTGNQGISLNYNLAIGNHLMLENNTQPLNIGESAVIKLIAQKSGIGIDTLIINNNGGVAEIRIPLNIETSGLNSGKKLAEPNIQLYPNPATDKLAIKLNQVESVRLQILNLQGQLQFSTVINGQFNEIATHSWPRGVYFVETIGAETKQVSLLLLN